MMDRNNFMSRIKVTQTLDYPKLFSIQRKVEAANINTIRELIILFEKLSESEKEELENIYKEQIEKLENDIKRKKHI